MNEQPVQSDEVAGGTKGETATIDLRKPSDVNLVYRAVLNGWDVPQPMRDAIASQMDAAMEAARAEKGRRGVRRVLRLVRLVMMMQGRDMIGEGHARGLFPYLRKRWPEKRRPRTPSAATDGLRACEKAPEKQAFSGGSAGSPSASE